MIYFYRIWRSSIYITNVRYHPLCREKSVEASVHPQPSLVIPNRRRRLAYGSTTLLHRHTTPAGARDIIDAAPASLGGQNPGEQENLGATNSKERNLRATISKVKTSTTMITKQQETGVEPTTSSVMKPRRNQLNHPSFEQNKKNKDHGHR